jgi:hypothetical protein
MLAAAGLPDLRLPRMTAAATARLARLLAVAAATAAVVLGSSVAAYVDVAYALRAGRCGRANRQGGHSGGQNKPGHDKNSLRFRLSTKMWEGAFLRPSSLHLRRAAFQRTRLNDGFPPRSGFG